MYRYVCEYKTGISCLECVTTKGPFQQHSDWLFSDKRELNFLCHMFFCICLCWRRRWNSCICFFVLMHSHLTSKPSLTCRQCPPGVLVQNILSICASLSHLSLATVSQKTKTSSKVPSSFCHQAANKDHTHLFKCIMI